MDVVKWCCKNQECKRMNLVESSKVDDAMKRKQKILLICGTCGYVHTQGMMKGPEGTNYLECIPYTNTELRPPIGRTPGGYTGDMGQEYNREDFILKYGIDPERYLLWRKAGKPRYKTVCE